MKGVSVEAILFLILKMVNSLVKIVENTTFNITVGK